MSMKECIWCGVEITAAGINYNKLLFCSEECRDDYQDDIASKSDVVLEDLDDEMAGPDQGEVDFEDLDLINDDLDGDSDYAAEDL